MLKATDGILIIKSGS